ncbi:MAG: sigma-54-dependent Fis family transcriptional regulator [Cyclobacteriaceae bacterium]|nr:sigma-54-dependent Fis family transcriptional regulator [Cyclobacteriaceae bacterium]
MQKILLIDDDRDICLLLERFLSKKNYSVQSCYKGDLAVELLKKEPFDLILCDYRLPDTNGLEMLQRIRIIRPDAIVIIITGYSDVRIAVQTLKYGAYDYVTKPLYPDEILLTIKEALQSGKSIGLDDATQDQQKNSGTAPKSNPDPKGFVPGVSAQSKTVQKHIDLIAPTDMSVIITGETGTGKEFVAKAIHQQSARRDKLFVAIDCGALPKDLAGSELFGHVKGAFTGAVQEKTGSFELANGGTLFLDEIGNLSYENQIKLLRVLQERKIRRVGGTKDIEIDVRILVATNEDLKTAVRDGKFREDIYHRLNEFKIELSPIRERKEDIVLFAGHFLRNANRQLNKNVQDFNPEVIELLQNYYWHGNLRELNNVVKRAVLLCQEAQINPECLPHEIIHNEPGLSGTGMVAMSSAAVSNLKMASENIEKQVIINMLEKTGYNKTKAAIALNIDRKTLYNKIKAYNIKL